VCRVHLHPDPETRSPSNSHPAQPQESTSGPMPGNNDTEGEIISSSAQPEGVNYFPHKIAPTTHLASLSRGNVNHGQECLCTEFHFIYFEFYQTSCFIHKEPEAEQRPEHLSQDHKCPPRGQRMFPVFRKMI
jgi:hypothetical protein